MLVLARLMAVIAVLSLPITASNPIEIHGHVEPYLQPRAVDTPTLVLSETPRAPHPTMTIGIVGVPLVFSATPTPTLAAENKDGIVGTPLAQAGKEVGSPVHEDGALSTDLALSSSTSHTIGATITLSTPTASSSAHTVATNLQLSTPTPTSTGIVGTPVSSTGSSFFTSHSIMHIVPNWGFLAIVIGSSLVFFTLVGLIVWRVRKYLAKKKAADEEDIFEAYSSYWKTKRGSGGIVGQMHITSPLDEKMGRKSYY
jgi:hypothetical protein